MADALAQAGIASIRFDFAGAGDSTEPFTKLSYTTMLADSNAALVWAVRNLPVDKDRIGGFGYSEGSAVVAMQAGQPFTPYKAVALLGPVANPREVFDSFFGGNFDAYYAEAQANGYAVVTTPFGQVQNTEPRVVPGDDRRRPGRRHRLLQGPGRADLGRKGADHPVQPGGGSAGGDGWNSAKRTTTVTIPTPTTVTASTRTSRTSTRHFTRHWCSSSRRR